MKLQQDARKRDRFAKKKEEAEEEKGLLPTSGIDYQTLLEQIPAVTYITTLDETGGRLYISPQIETMLGFPSSEWLTDPQLWFRQIYPDDRKRVLMEYYKCHNKHPGREQHPKRRSRAKNRGVAIRFYLHTAKH